MKQLETIQTIRKLNDVFATDDAGAGGACHLYMICREGAAKLEGTAEDMTLRVGPNDVVGEIAFQNGARDTKGAVNGVLDCDLLEIVRDRLTDFQRGDYACKENERALKHVEQALRWMNKRVEDRAARGVLGTMKK